MELAMASMGGLSGSQTKFKFPDCRFSSEVGLIGCIGLWICFLRVGNFLLGLEAFKRSWYV